MFGRRMVTRIQKVVDSFILRLGIFFQKIASLSHFLCTQNSSKKIEAGIRGGSGDNNLLADLAQGIVSSSNERRSTCSFSVRQDEANIVKILKHRPDIRSPVVPESSHSNSVSQNLCAVVVTKSGLYYKYACGV